ncbi:hypothetical protein HDU89_000951 [Geranomyces variabilis]|nr:hypothetical protein HDU89_000951 [Geranomyces variabilis]
MNPNKIRALLRGLRALKKDGNSKKGSSKGENKARDSVWDKASEIVRKAVAGELGKEKTVVELVKDADDPVLAGSKDGPTDGIKASHIAEDVGGSMAEAEDRIIGDRMTSLIKTKLGLNARKLAQSFKNVAKSIGKNLAKSSKLTPEAKAELQSNLAALKGFRDDQVNKIAGTPRATALACLGIATNAILGDAQQVTGSSQGVTTDFTSVNLPDALATMADAIGAKHELQALGDLNAVDPTIGLAGGYSPEVTNSGAEPAIGGIGEYVRELTPKEIAADVADGATVEDASNSVAEKAMTVLGASTRFLKHPRFTRACNALRRGLKNLKKGLNLREKGQKALAPSDCKDAPAMRAEAMRANMKDMSQRAKSDLGVSGESSPLSSGSGSSNKLTNEDFRSADTVISVGIVDALGDLKLDNEASGILPGGDIPASDDPGATIEPPMLFRGANSMDDVLQGASDEVGQELGFNSKTMSELKKVKALRGLSKLAKMAKAAKRDVVAGVGRESSGALSGAIQALGTLERSAGGVAAGAERGDTAQGLDLPAMDIEPVASNSFDVNTPTKLTTLAEAHPGSRATTRSWNSRLKNVRNRMLKSATGRALKTGKSNTAGKP